MEKYYLRIKRIKTIKDYLKLYEEIESDESLTKEEVNSLIDMLYSIKLLKWIRG